MTELSTEIRNQVYNLAKAGRKFMAAHILKKETGLKSKQAKELVKQILAEGPDSVPEPQSQSKLHSVSPNLLPMLDEQTATMVLEYTRNGNKITAIKILRAKAGLGLKEAKDVIEAL